MRRRKNEKVNALYRICLLLCRYYELGYCLNDRISTRAFTVGITGAGIAPGVLLIAKYFYWTNPARRVDYEARLKNEAIQLNDERKIMLRDKSGRLAYIAMMLLQLVLTFVFSILSILEYFYPFSKYACIGLSILLIIQYVFGIVAYRRLSKSL